MGVGVGEIGGVRTVDTSGVYSVQTFQKAPTSSLFDEIRKFSFL